MKELNKAYHESIKKEFLNKSVLQQVVNPKCIFY